MKQSTLSHGLQALAILITLTSARASFAAYEGWVNGVVYFVQRQGNYCPNQPPTNRDCTGARYWQDDYLQYEPIHHTILYVRDQDKKIIGQGATDWDGNYNIKWRTTSAMPTSAHLAWKYEHKDGRFSLRQPSGGGWVSQSGSFALRASNTVTYSPTFTAHGYTNVYDGAVKAWSWSLGTAGLMASRFNDVQIRVFYDPLGSECPLGFAHGPENYVCLPDNVAYKPQACVMHELGHMASYLSQPDMEHAGYGYDGDSTWYNTSEEWLSTRFEEGLASFFASAALYANNAAAPHFCNSDSYCSGPNAWLEANTQYKQGEARHRWPLSAMRGLWDVYDTNNESLDDKTCPVWYFITALNEFPTGTTSYCAGGVWDSSRTYFDEPDVRTGYHFRYHMLNRRGVDIYNTLFNSLAL